MSLSPTQRATHALKRFAQAGASKSVAAETCELCATPLSATHDHLLDPRARRAVCSCKACAMLFPDAPDSAQRYVRVQSPLAALLEIELSERDLHALGVPVRLAVLCPSALHDALFMLYPSAAGPVEGRAAFSAWSALAGRHIALEAVRLDRDAVIVDLRAERSHLLHVSLDLAYELLGTLQTPDRMRAFDLRLAALVRTGGARA